MNIYGKIVTAMVAFETLTGQRPGLVYAGEDEIAELKEWAMASGGSFPVELGGTATGLVMVAPGSFVAGLTVVEVKDESFLSVGIQI